MKTRLVWSFTLFLLSFLLSTQASATHLRAAQITVERVSGLTFKITVTAYMNTQSATLFGGSSFDDGAITMGDGNFILIPEINATPRPDLGTNIGVATFVTTYTYATDGLYKINYRERDRSAGILNIPNAGDVAYSSSAIINTKYVNHFPTLNIPPVDKACSKQIFSHNAGAADQDGDLLTYELTVPHKDADNEVEGYLSPDTSLFYSNSNYNTANEAGTGPPLLSVDKTTGQITWNAPGNLGEYNIAFKISEWRLNVTTGELELLSEFTRDMQIIVEDCFNSRPVLTTPANLCVESGTVIHFQVTGSDPEGSPVKLEAISEIFDFAPAKIPATHLPAIFGFTASPAALSVHWNTNCIHSREQPYQIVFKATDNPSNAASPLVTFSSVSVKVLAPAPKWVSGSVDLSKRSGLLKWNDYTCQNAESIQVWRRVGSYNYNPSPCDAGLPQFYGYELVGSLNPTAKEFNDTNKAKGLTAGAQYCYRLIAFFKQPSGGSSYVSEELCLEPIQADAPVITHVSVEKTHPRQGAIRVSWRSPFDINANQFPRPYEYEIYRADSLDGDKGLVKVGRVRNDTTFLNTLIDTEKKRYNYRIVIYAIPKNFAQFIPIDTSAIASSVWLEVKPGPKKIELNWNAKTPWSNVVQGLSKHLIFRGLTDDENNMTLIDSVDVSQTGFTYTDVGKFGSEPLKDDQLYYYKVETRGTYGNPKIKVLLNFSQRVLSYPDNNLLPCKPVVHVDPADCEAFYSQGVCENYNLTNTLHWGLTQETGCRTDIVAYRLYAADSQEEEFKLIASDLTDTTFTENGLPEFARCYRIEAIDGLGQISEKSDITCNDNCLYYELPNVFTPNGDGCNDHLSAFNPNAPNQSSICTTQNTSRCPSFAEQVKFTVFDRWGKKLYSYTSGNGKSIYIDWDGRDDKGNLLGAAIYYYTAEVKYSSTNPSKKNQTHKGWVQLIR